MEEKTGCAVALYVWSFGCSAWRHSARWNTDPATKSHVRPSGPYDRKPMWSSEPRDQLFGTRQTADSTLLGYFFAGRALEVIRSRQTKPAARISSHGLTISLPTWRSQAVECQTAPPPSGVPSASAGPAKPPNPSAEKATPTRLLRPARFGSQLPCQVLGRSSARTVQGFCLC